jgi:PAS domain S-box-containing protein
MRGAEWKFEPLQGDAWVMCMNMNKQKVSESMDHSQLSKSVIDQLPQPALVLDMEGRVVIWNTSMERFTGIPAGEIIGNGNYAHAKALFGELRPTLSNCILDHSEVSRDHYRHLILDGEEIFAESLIPMASGRYAVCMAAPLYSGAGKRIGAVETIRDITEQKSTEDTLKMSEEQKQILIKSLPDIIFTLNRDGVFTQFFWTDAQKLGINPGEIVGKTPHALLPRDEADRLIEACRQVIDTGQIVSEMRTFQWRGSMRSFQTTIHPLHDSAGKIVAATGVSRDMTRYVMNERTVQETNQLADLYLDLLSTDIYNTSMVAATVIEMLRERLSGEEAELAMRVKNTVEQGINVIKNVELLNTLNKHRIRLEPVDLDKIIRSQILRYAGIDIRYSGCTCMVWANPLLEHIFSNLISNSIKFGGMKVRIDINVMETGEIVTVTIADNGIGIPDPLKPNIFDRFTRGGKTASGSRGLGLHIVKTLITRYGGRVWAADRVPGKPEEGAAMKVILQKC